MRPIRRHLLSLLLGSFFLAAALGFAGPAAAHDAAESSNPAQGASLPAPPEQVSVTFNNNPLGIGASISIKDAAGTEWADGPVQIVDNVASQKLRAGGLAGEYTVSWRVVSSDSHPIEGSFGFTAAGAAGGTPQATGTTAPAAVPGMGTAEPGVTAEPSVPADSGEPFQWSIVVFAAAALGLLAALAVIARRRLSVGGEEQASGE
ncbi:copper resistance protein CopC [Pseudarthrobacter sp. NamE2]|uniref:copper resistance CopC family protein n=1 Tax=Pseudarthrobacter sp. NamE2 TaxID=2576838 RepID=UPI0010FDCF22|nr:copper resistance CopC family protein [Pseudarthrobacter sp. NamE2]TLM82139.1 copper resistance protein CopC [Pseudarthrobacter sp. NamE2]